MYLILGHFLHIIAFSNRQNLISPKCSLQEALQKWQNCNMAKNHPSKMVKWKVVAKISCNIWSKWLESWNYHVKKTRVSSSSFLYFSFFFWGLSYFFFLRKFFVSYILVMLRVHILNLCKLDIVLRNYHIKNPSLDLRIFQGKMACPWTP